VTASCDTQIDTIPEGFHSFQTVEAFGSLAISLSLFAKNSLRVAV